METGCRSGRTFWSALIFSEYLGNWKISVAYIAIRYISVRYEISNPRKKVEARTGTTTADAVLGLLSIAPMSGYGMRMIISQSIGHFWSESFGQIYPALRKLTAEGFVEKKTERQKGRPDRHMYSLTTAGRKRLAGWLMVPAVTEVPRNELLLKLFFGSHVPVRRKSGECNGICRDA